MRNILVSKWGICEMFIVIDSRNKLMTAFEQEKRKGCYGF
jgi:hypothetical protein